MPRARRGGVSDFAKGFADTFGAFDDVGKIVRDNQMRHELANQSQNGGIRSTDAVSGEDAYQNVKAAYDAATPEQQAALQPTMDSIDRNKPASVISSMGVGANFKTQPDKPFTQEDQILNNMAAREGIYRKYGKDEEADRMQSNSLNRQLTGLQIQGAQRQERMSANDEANKAEAQKVFEGSLYIQKQKDYAAKMSDYQARMQAGDATAVAPEKPSYGVAESLLDHANMLAFKIKTGKAGTEELVKLTEMQKQLQDEGYAKALKVAQGGASVEEVAKIFNESGKSKLDPAAIVSDKWQAGADGTKTRIISFKDAAGNVQTINTLSELDALGKADSIFSRMFEGKKVGAEEKKADAANTAATAAAGLHNEQSKDAKLKRLGAIGAGKLRDDPNAALTDDEKAGVQYVQGGNQIAKNTPEAQNAALGKLDAAAKDYLKMGDTQLTNLDQKAVDKRQAIYLRTMELGKRAVAQSRTIDPASIIKQAEDEQTRRGIIGGGTGSSASPALSPSTQKVYEKALNGG